MDKVMAEGERPTEVRTSYVLVDNVRFWSMMAIVAMHSLYFAWLGAAMGRRAFAGITVLKFGTVGFFVISGFLLGDRVRTDKPGTYLMKRLKKVAVPWSLWFVVMAGITIWLFHRYEGKQVVFGWNLAEVRIVVLQVKQTMFGSAFWFVPNLLLGICVILLFRRVLYRKELGAGLLVVNLFYSANIYGHWIPSGHQEALLGYVFLLWLGSYAAHHYARFQGWLGEARWGTLVGLAVLGVGASFAEEMWLLHLHAPDPVNTLRVSNLVMSVVLLLLIAKLERPMWPGFVDVRRNTFGIYLTHWMVLVGCWHAGRRVFMMEGTTYGQIGFWQRVVFAGVLFVMAYGISLGLTRALAGTPSLAWMVGAEGGKGRVAVNLSERRVEDGHHVLGVGADAVVSVGFGKEDAA